MSVNYAVELPTMHVDRPEEFLSAEAIAELARAAEAAGFAAVYVTDHPAGDAKWLDHGGHHALDPFVALWFAAAATTSLRLLTNVLIVAYRNPFLAAKSVLSLDVLSGGRLILGTAAGYLKPEFQALGVDFDERNDLLDEALTVMREAWAGGDVAVEGRHFRSHGVRMRPLPVSKPHPPIWMGGNSQRAMRRVVETCEGWAPFATVGYAQSTRTAEISTVADITARIEQARRHATEVGRTEPLDVCFSAFAVSDESLPIADRRAEAEQLEAAGVTWTTVPAKGEHRQAVLDQIHRFGDEIITA